MNLNSVLSERSDYLYRWRHLSRRKIDTFTVRIGDRLYTVVGIKVRRGTVSYLYAYEGQELSEGKLVYFPEVDESFPVVRVYSGLVHLRDEHGYSFPLLLRA